MKLLLKRRKIEATEPFPSTTCCKTFVIVIYAKGAGVVRFHTYSYGNMRAAECTVVEAALAMSVAHTFFKPVTIKFASAVTPVTYLDGGVGSTNNPMEQAIIEARQIWEQREIGVLVSIGTGTTMPPSFTHSRFGMKTEINVVTFIASCITHCQETHRQIIQGSLIASTCYFHFNVEYLGNIKLEEWEELPTVTSLTEQYMDDNEEKKSKCINAILIASGLVRKYKTTLTLLDSLY